MRLNAVWLVLVFLLRTTKKGINRMTISKKELDRLCDALATIQTVKSGIKDNHPVEAARLESIDRLLHHAIGEIDIVWEAKPTYPPFRGDVPVCRGWLERYTKPTGIDGKNRFYNLFGRKRNEGIYICSWGNSEHYLEFSGTIHGEDNPTRDRIIELGTALKYEFQNDDGHFSEATQ